MLARDGLVIRMTRNIKPLTAFWIEAQHSRKTRVWLALKDPSSMSKPADLVSQRESRSARWKVVAWNHHLFSIFGMEMSSMSLAPKVGCAVQCLLYLTEN